MKKYTRSKRTTYVKNSFIYLVLIIGAVWTTLPFIWMLFSSFKDPNAIFTYPPEWIPKHWRYQNYLEIWKVVPLAHWFLNSIFVAVLATLGNVIGSSLAAYAFALLKFKGRNALFNIVLSTMMIPYQVVLIPMFLLMKYLGWIDSFKPLIIPAFAGSAFGIFLMRQFIAQLPRELFDAAQIDGANAFQIFFRLVIPMIKPALATLGLFAFLGSWNDLLDPLIYLYTKNKFTLPLGLTYFQGQYAGMWHYLMVGSVIATVPIIIVFFFTQRYFVEGIKLSGLKI